MKKSRKRHAGKQFRGDVSKQHGTPQDPADHVANRMKDPEGGAHDGTQLGTQAPAAFPASNIYGMQGGAYPGQDIGAE